MTETMRAAVLERPGEELRVEEIPVPTPGPGEVLVRVDAVGVCHTDLHVIKGEVPFPTPAVLGHEVSGIVAAVGPGVGGLKEGDRVVAPFIMPCGRCDACAAGRDDLCARFFEQNRLRGTLYDGTSRLRRRDGSTLAMYSMAGLAEACVVPATGVFALPEPLPLRESAILGCALFTAYGAVRRGADLRAGETAAIVAAGGVGLGIVQVARAFGAARVIAVDVRAEQLRAAEELGATDVVNGLTGDAVAAVRDLTGGRGVDVAFEALGRPETVVQAVEMLADGGRAVVVGIGAGAAAAPIEITRLVRRELRILGSYGARTRTDMPAVIGLALRGQVRPEREVTRTFSLEEAGAAYLALDRGEITGRALVLPSPG